VLWSANSLSNLSDGLAFVSMPLLAASMTDDPRMIAGLAVMYSIVRLTVVLPIGVWVDRVDRRSLLVAANLLRGAALLAFAFTIQFGFASLLMLYVVMALVGVFESLADNAAVAILPSLVRRERLDKANGRIAAVQLIADEFVGPPLGGFLFALAAAAPMLAMGSLWGLAGLFALALPRRTADAGPRPPRRSVYAEARDGVRWLVRHRIVGSLALIGALASVGYMLPFSILVLVAEQNLGLDGGGYGVLLAFSALGGLLGSFIAPRLRDAVGYRWTIVASLALGAMTLAGLAFTSDAVVAGILLALYILHAVVWNICAASLRQRLVPDNLLGRVGAAGRVCGLLGLAVGAALGGLLATVNVSLAVAAGAAVFAACTLVAVFALRRGIEFSAD